MPDFVVENFGPPAGHGVQSRRFQANENVGNGQLRNLGDVENLGGREAMTVNLESLFDRRKQVFVIIDLQIRMDAALHQNAGATESEGFFDLLIDDVIGQNVGFRITLHPIERAERAEFSANIGVIDIPVNDVADDVVRMETLPDGICGICEVQKIGFLE